MIDLQDSTFFTPYTHPESGITSYVLTERVAPVQEAFYFVNASMTRDGRYLWFYCAFPPSGSAQAGRSLGVFDFETGETVHFPDTQFGNACPYVDVDSGEVYWMSGPVLWKRNPDPGTHAEPVNELPAALIGSRRLLRTATHLTRSADGSEFFVDFRTELGYYFGTLPVDGGDFELWYRFDRNYNHAQFSPTDPDLILYAEENHPDPITGMIFPIRNRMWLLRRGGEPKPVFDEVTRVTHEWWDSHGEHVWCVRGNDTWRVRIADGHTETFGFPRHSWHSHSSADGRLIVGDSHAGEFYRGCASTVHFMNRDTGRTVVVADNPERHDYVGRNYHIDPHPRFNADERFVTFTTTALGTVDVAIVPTESLLDATK
jgi:hypothetical protein